MTTSPATDSPVGKQQPNAESDESISIKEILPILHRHRKLIFCCLVAGLIFSIIYIVFTAPRYTASTSILIDPRQQNVLPVLGQDQLGYKESLILDSQIEVIKSNKLLQKAAAKTNLYKGLDDTEPKGFLATVKSTLFGAPNKQKMQAQTEIAKQARFNGFRGAVGVQRIDKTFVIRISYTSGNPKLAAKRANLIADVYLEDELEAQYEIAQRTNNWLKTRLKKLQQDLSAAEQAVENYKEENNIVQTSNRTSISDQQLSELNSKLVMARSEAAQAQAQYDMIQIIIAEGDPNMLATDSLNNNVINKLRGEYIQLSRRATEIRRDQGAEHQAYRNLKRQMGDIQSIIMNEYKRIAESYRNAMEIAQSKVKVLHEELNLVSDSSMVSQRSQIELRELERQAESMRNLYTKMLDSFNEQAERQSIPQVHARIINYASVPQSPSWPKTNIILMGGLFIGGVLGLALAFLREQVDKFIWKTEELENATHRTCLGMLPKVVFDTSKLGELSKKWESESVAKGSGTRGKFNVSGFSEITQFLEKQTHITTEVMRNVQLAVRFNKDKQDSKKGTVISFVSALSGEGKSVTSCFLAKHMALAGKKVALIDCDFRRPSLTNWFCPNADTGFYDLALRVGLESREETLSNLSSICHKTDNEQLFFIPAKGSDSSIDHLNFVASGQMNTLVEYLQKVFDVVIIDLPPIINIVDARVIANVVDSFIFLAHWGKTDRDVVHRALNRAPEVHNKTVGTLLTLVDTTRASNYGYYNYNYYYYHRSYS